MKYMLYEKMKKKNPSNPSVFSHIRTPPPANPASSYLRVQDIRICLSVRALSARRLKIVVGITLCRLTEESSGTRTRDQTGGG